jgi:hypothetical protein
MNEWDTREEFRTLFEYYNTRILKDPSLMSKEFIILDHNSGYLHSIILSETLPVFKRIVLK